MSSERNTERLVDLIYGEAMDDQEKNDFLEEIAESRALQSERDEIRALLGDVSDVWSEGSVSDTLHNAIMDAAKAATNERAEKKHFVSPTKPAGLWSRLKSSSQLGQIAMVATVVIAGAFVFRFVNFDEGAHVDEEVAVFLPEKDEASANLDTMPSPAAVENPTAMEKQEGFGLKPTDESADSKIGAGEKAKVTSISKASKKDITLSSPPAKSVKKKIAKTKTATGKERTASKRSRSKSKLSKGNSASPGVFKNKAYFDKLDDSSPQSSESYEQRVEDAEELNLVPSKTIESVNSKYSSRDYAGTIKAADEFVGNKSGTSNERARALQLKAQSLANLGRNSEALRVYDSILKNYKNFQSSAISSARAEISRKLEERRPAEKKRKMKKSQKAFDESAVETK